MNPQHITNKALAIASGIDKFHIHDFAKKKGKHEIKYLVDGEWMSFEYTDPLVIWTIAKRFNCFPWRDELGYWWANVEGCKEVQSQSPELAVAMAVIEAAKK